MSQKQNEENQLITMNLPTERVIEVLDTKCLSLQRGIDELYDRLKTMKGEEHDTHVDIRNSAIVRLSDLQTILKALRSENPTDVTVDATKWGRLID